MKLIERLLRGLLLRPTLNLLGWILKRTGNSIIIGGPLGWSWEPTLDEQHHGSLVGPTNAHRHGDLANIGIDDHHARDHAMRHGSGEADAVSLDASQIGTGRFGMARMPDGTDGYVLVAKGAGVDPAYEEAPPGIVEHVLATDEELGLYHTIAGAAAGDVLRATAPTAARFQQLPHGDLGGVGIDDHHDRDHAGRHNMGEADALSVGTPSSIGASNGEGSESNFVRRDHVHAHGTTRRCDGNFAGAADFRIETRTTDPASPADGRMWLRTDL